MNPEILAEPVSHNHLKEMAFHKVDFILRHQTSLADNLQVR